MGWNVLCKNNGSGRGQSCSEPRISFPDKVTRNNTAQAQLNDAAVRLCGEAFPRYVVWVVDGDFVGLQGRENHDGAYKFTRGGKRHKGGTSHSTSISARKMLLENADLIGKRFEIILDQGVLCFDRTTPIDATKDLFQRDPMRRRRAQ